MYICRVTNQPIRVTHVSYSNSGGAGTVARRLKEYQAGHLDMNSNFMCITKESLRKNPFADPLVFLAALKDEFFVKKRSSTPMLSLYRNRTNRKILDEIHNLEGIIHFHWINGVIQIFDLHHRLMQKKKVVWTMHDMEPFTGGCHHALSCEQFKSICIECPITRDKYRKDIMKQHIKKINYLQILKNFKFVTPSYWLKLSAQKSFLLRNEQITVIYNPVENIFFENDASFKLHDIKSDDFIVGFVSTNLNLPLKNYKTLKIIVGRLNQIATTKFKILAIGKNRRNLSRNDVVEVGEVADTLLMSRYYKSMSVLVVASSAESFGLSVVEAAASEVPTIVLAGTASQELVVHEKTGFVAESNEEIFKYLKLYSENPFTLLSHGKQAKIYAKQNFSEKMINNKYLKLYNSFY